MAGDLVYMKLVDQLGSGIVAGVFALSVCGGKPEPSKDGADMFQSQTKDGADMSNRKQQVAELLKSLKTDDPKPLQYINPNKYIQHNLAVGDGMAGRFPKERPRSTP
jgi:hypothetical protein